MKQYLRKIIPESLINLYHKLNAILANIIYGFPGRKLTIIGITGTNGKTTSAYMISKILDESGNKNAMISTIYFKLGEKFIRNNSKMTTLDPFVIQKFLHNAVKQKCNYAIIETTSHAIVQHRIWGIKYDALLFTNITHDHLDYHKTFKNYLSAKTKLFYDNKNAKAVLNADDPHSKDFEKAKNKKIITYSIASKGNINAKKQKNYIDGSTFSIAWGGYSIDAKINLPGSFNISNALGAFAVCMLYNISPKTATNALEKIKNIPGRFEYLDFGQNFKIIVDFAHTPDGLEKILRSISPYVKGNLIHVSGATGDRDKTKRPILGAITGKYADIVIISNEDPGHEEPEKIIEEVASGVTRGATKNNPKTLGKNFFKINERDKAIKFALSIAKKDDTVLITGKGHEKVMNIAGKLIDYSDQEVVKEYFKSKQRS